MVAMSREDKARGVVVIGVSVIISSGGLRGCIFRDSDQILFGGFLRRDLQEIRENEDFHQSVLAEFLVDYAYGVHSFFLWFRMPCAASHED